jgi:phosphoribosylanthranilate isomerase
LKQRTRVKICGITRVEDAVTAATLGTDAIGLVFYPKSPRYVEIEQAAEICARIPAFVTTVALFMDANEQQVSDVLQRVPIDLLQFHGTETTAACEGFGRPYIKAVAMKPDCDIRQEMNAHPAASGYLLDAWQPDTHGGGGVAFDWNRVPTERGGAVILAGGLTPENVTQAVKQTRPFAVDVSSGVEVEKGIKSAEMIEAFIRGVQRGDASQ